MLHDVFLQEQNEIHPKLNPPVYRWQEDMPGNNEPQLVPPQLIWLNTKNDIWIEIPRYNVVSWVGCIFGGMISLVMTIYSVIISLFIGGDMVIYSENIFGKVFYFLVFLFLICSFFQCFFLRFIFLNQGINLSA